MASPTELVTLHRESSDKSALAVLSVKGERPSGVRGGENEAVSLEGEEDSESGT